MRHRFGPAVLVLALVPLFAAGCGTQADKRVLEELGMVSVIGFDLKEGPDAEEEISNRTTILFPVINPQAKAEEDVLTVRSRSNEARQELSRMTDRKLVFGQLRTVVFNARVAERGLLNDLDALLRDPTVGTRVKLVLTDGNVQELLSFRHSAIPRIGRYIDLLLEKENVQLFIPTSNLHTFYRDVKDDGIDPVVPFIELSGDTVEVDGIGLFRDERLAGKVEADDMPYFVMLHGPFRQGTVSVALKGNELVTLGALRSKREIRMRRKAGGGLAAEIRVSLNGSVTEYTGDTDFKTERSREQLVKQIEGRIREQCERQLKHMQRLRADCIGIGQVARSLYSFSEWKKLDWRETFAAMDIRVKVKLRIMDFGVYP